MQSKVHPRYKTKYRVANWAAYNQAVRLEFPIFSLNPGLRQRCVAPDVWAGEWAAAKHGGRGRRGWRKLHLGVDQSGMIRVHTLTEATGDDATTALDLLTAVDGPLVRVTADAAYDTVALYKTAGARGATVVIPPARTATVSGHGPRSPARDRTITLVKQLGRRQWQKASGYHRQSRVENTFFRYTSIIGDGLRARSPAGQGSEVVLGCEILNRMTALGRPVSYRIGR